MPARYPFSADFTLRHVRAWLNNHVADGAICPACDQHAKIHERRLYSSMVAGLIYLHRYFMTYRTQRWVHAEELFRAVPHARTFRGDFAKLRFWGLIEHKDPYADDRRTNNGECRITEDGIAFVRRRLLCPAYMLVYANRVLGSSPEYVEITQVLGPRQHYSTMMRWRPPRRIV